MESTQAATTVRLYSASDWISMWQLRFAQLTEHGIHLDPEAIPTEPVGDGAHVDEWDMDQIDQFYVSGGGGFWLARQEGEPVGYVGAQDLGGVAELRRMYVKAAHRRQGIGTLLVQVLIERCRASGMRAVELWTPEKGNGHLFYTALGFEKVEKPLLSVEAVVQATRRVPNPQEIRMRLRLSDQAPTVHPTAERADVSDWSR